MPICTTCTTPTPYLYTIYQSKHNLRLEQCSQCHNFADPYVEHDSLILLLDLFLLKRGVFRHLLYNRGSGPRRAPGAGQLGEQAQVDDAHTTRDREKLRWLLVLRLGGALVLVDAFIRWTHLNPDQPNDVSPWTRETSIAFLRILGGCLAETVAFQSAVILTCYLMLHLRDLLQPPKPHETVSGIRHEFRFSLIPLSLLYSSLTKFFLLFLLSIWRPHTRPVSPSPHHSANYLSSALEILDDDKLDREWVVRNVLGGMAAGFGLRVILDAHPVFTTVIVLSGWAIKTAMAMVVSRWVGGDEIGAAWLEYSIP